MADVSWIGPAVQATANLADTITDNVVNWNIAQENLNYARETNKHNEELMREAWARDDSARQRMVADLEKAGLSKWLAAGASPMSSSPVSIASPENKFQMNSNIGGAMDNALHAYSNMLQAEETKKQTELLEQQRLAAVADTKTREAEAKIKEHDAKVYEGRPNSASNDPQYLKYIDQALQALGNMNNKGGIGEQLDNAKKGVVSRLTNMAKDYVEDTKTAFQTFPQVIQDIKKDYKGSKAEQTLNSVKSKVKESKAYKAGSKLVGDIKDSVKQTRKAKSMRPY